MHGHSRVSGASYRGLGAALEEVGNELSAQRVVDRLFPLAKLEGRMTELHAGAYHEQIDKVLEVVSKATGKTTQAARDLVIDAHYRGILTQRGTFGGKDEAVRTLLDALDVTPSERQAIEDGLLAAL